MLPIVCYLLIRFCTHPNPRLPTVPFTRPTPAKLSLSLSLFVVVPPPNNNTTHRELCVFFFLLYFFF